jgi:hypothetical protein
MWGRKMDKETEKLEREVRQLRQEVSDMKRLLGALMSIIMEEDVEVGMSGPFLDMDMDDFSRPN